MLSDEEYECFLPRKDISLAHRECSCSILEGIHLYVRCGYHTADFYRSSTDGRSCVGKSGDGLRSMEERVRILGRHLEIKGLK